METNGDLVLSWKGRPLWSSRTSGHAGAVADMQGDGNFVIYAGHRAVWSSATGGHTHSAFYLAVRNDGNVVIYTSANELIWASGTLVSRTKAVHRSLRRPSHRPAA